MLYKQEQSVVNLKYQAIRLFAKLFTLLMLVGGGNSAWAVNNSLDFDGVNDYVEVPYNSALNPAAFTVSAK